MIPSIWPSAEQLLLLRAALGEDGDAPKAFTEWRRRVDYEQVLDGGSFRMLPLVHANMVRLGYVDPSLARLSGIYRHSWCTVQHRIRLAAETVSMLRAHDVPVLVAKGLPIALYYYDSPGLRPMSDIDLVVPRTQLFAALDLLKARGWHTSDAEGTRRLREHPQGMFAANCAVQVTGPNGAEIDLHWRMIAECARDEVDQRFWRDAEAFMIGDVEALRPAPTHLLFHVIVHGLKPNALPPIRWVADATMILRRDAAKIDWPEMAALSRASRVCDRLARGIAYLRDTMGVALPEEASRLTNTRPCWVERIEQRAFRDRLTHSAGPAPLKMELVTWAARMAVGSGRAHMPGQAARWLSRRLSKIGKSA